MVNVKFSMPYMPRLVNFIKTPSTLLLAVIFLCMTLLAVNNTLAGVESDSGNRRAVDTMAKQASADTLLVFWREQYYFALPQENQGKKIRVHFLSTEALPKKNNFRKKDIFHLRKPDDLIIPKELRFRYTDPFLADDIFIKARVIGYNQNHFLLEFHHNNKKQVTAKHKSAIVQKDLPKNK